MDKNNSQSLQSEASLHVQDYFQIFRNYWKVALLVFLLVFASCAIITKLQQPKYSSISTIEIIPPRDIINVATTQERNPIFSVLNESDAYLETQYEIMVSQQNLSAVVNKLDLAREWSMSEIEAVNDLRRMVSISPRALTNLVDVEAKTTDPLLAQQICSAVVDCYKELRDEKERAIIKEAIDKRYEVLRSRQDELERKADVVRQYIRSGKYIQNMWSQDGVHSTPVSAGSEEQSYATLVAAREKLESEIAQMRVHVTKLQDLKDEELRDYVTRTGLLTAESYCSDRVRQLNEQYLKESDEKSQMLLAGYGERHPNIIRMDEQHKNTLQQLNDELIGMRDAMVDQIEVKQAELQDVTNRSEQAKERLRNKSLEDQKVKDALQEYAAEKARYDKLENDYIADKMRMMAPRTSIEIYTQPVVATTPCSPNFRLNLLAGAVLGIIAGVITAFVFNYFDTSIKSLEDAERSLGLPVLGVIPQDAGVLLLQGADSPDAEAYRILRANVELKREMYKASTFAVTSANAGEGKTLTLLNLACVFAQAGYSTLMIDADMRRPRLSRYAELKADVGLADYLADGRALSEVVFRTSNPNLYLMPAGKKTSDPSGLITSQRMDQLLSEVSKRFDVILIDTPPLLGVSDTSLLVNRADVSLFVLQPRKMPLSALVRAKNVLLSAGGRIMGLVLNNVDINNDSQYQYYTTYYSYYAQEDRGGEKTQHRVAKKDGRAEKSVTSDTASEEDIY
ncbi:MAG: polysaccharide biosynthesis tyrosine autokinase [Akkermansia sp.]|nr:polysaccharide biosynthesis tyrosine autokinase [Akkermansia sp.]